MPFELPDALRRLAGAEQWVAWDDVGGRKVPKSPHGGNAKSNDPSTWGSFEDAASAAEANGFTGVGIELDGGLVGIDLDGCVHDGKIDPWAQEIIDSVASYAELSPSGTGVHVLAYADPTRTGAIGRADHRRGIEVYNHGRYFTVTGRQVGSSGIEDRTEEVSRLVSERFRGESPEQSLARQVGRLARDQVARRANETTSHNVGRDAKRGARFARVPMGTHACQFCLMLASRGFVYHSAQTAGEFGHYHSDCRCKVVAGFPEMAYYWKNGVKVSRGKDPTVEGYDPDALLKLWKDLSSIDNRKDLSPLEKSAYKAFLSAGGDTEFTARHAVGAKAITDYVVHMPSGNDTVFFPGSEVEVKKVFAGSGSDPEKVLRVAKRLSDEYGGNPEDWSHVSGEGWIFDPDDNGRIRRAEVHWMECQDVGRVEFYFKRWAKDQ
jgi:hypothetical protein